MRRIILVTLLVTCYISFLQAQSKYEFRAAWLTTAYALDWPNEKANSAKSIKRQKDELCRILDKLKVSNFNTILFQTRLRGDVIYPSSIEPYSRVLTGQNNKSPGYDPLAFAIEECHKRGLELHAWIVAIPLGQKKHITSLGKTSIVHKNPSLCKQYKGEWFLDPGNPATKEYLYSIVKEITTRYDIDGVHLDYIRYPDRPEKFPDQDSFRKYGKGKSLSDWRRDNITTIVRKIYEGVKEIKPWVKVSSSPIGKFKDTSRYSSFGWNAYNTVYQDAQGWLQDGIHDIVFPMMYFEGNQFYPFALDWQEKSYGRYIVPGLGIYFMHHTEKNWPCSLIERQINFTRQHHLAGQAYYRVQHLMEDTKGIYSELTSGYYAHPALIPPMRWQNNTTPSAPINFNADEKEQKVKLSWSASVDHDARIVPYYTIYGSNTYPVDINNPQNIIATRIWETYYEYAFIYPNERKRYFAVTASNRYGNESTAIQQIDLSQLKSPLHIKDYLFLPPNPFAEFITITDITGRSVMSALYNNDYINVNELKSGFYRLLVTEESGKVSHLGDIIK